MKYRLLKFSLLILLLIVVICGQLYTRKRGVQVYEEFYSANIKGVLSDVSIKYKGVSIVVNNGSQYVFYPYTGSINGSHNFENFAKPGDYVTKAFHSDTLYLNKNNKVYKYTFSKPY